MIKKKIMVCISAFIICTISILLIETKDLILNASSETISPGSINFERGRIFYLGTIDQDVSDNGDSTDQSIGKSSEGIPLNKMFDKDSDPIAWISTGIDNDEIYAISKTILMSSAFGSADYASSTHKAWLDDIFSVNAFNFEELIIINKQKLSGSGSVDGAIFSNYEETSKDDNGHVSYSPSYTEIQNYGLIELISDYVNISDYTLNKNGLSGMSMSAMNAKLSYVMGKIQNRSLITRTTGNVSRSKVYVVAESGGVFGTSRIDYDNAYWKAGGIDPAIKLNKTKLTYGTYAGSDMDVTKNSNKLTEGISEDGLKLTALNDSMKIELSAPTLDGITSKESSFDTVTNTYYFSENSTSKLRIHFMNASNNKTARNSSSAYYITVIISDNDKKVMAMGRYPYNNGTEGEFDLDFPSNLINGNYNVQIALEEVNKDVVNNGNWNNKAMNYSSALSDPLPIDVSEMKFTIPTQSVTKTMFVGDTLTMESTINKSVDEFEWYKKNPSTNSWESIKIQNTGGFQSKYEKTAELNDSGEYKVVGRKGSMVAESEIFKIEVQKKKQTLTFTNSDSTVKIPSKTGNTWTEFQIPIVKSINEAPANTYFALIDSDEGTGDIEIKSSNTNVVEIVNGKLVVKSAGIVTLSAQKIEASDSGYESSDIVTIKLQIYTGLSADYEEIKKDLKQGSDDVRANTVIGHIINQSGTPNASGKLYTYALKTNVNDTNGNPNFAIDADGNLSIVNSPLKYGSYNIVITITDAIESYDIPVTVNVGLEEQGDFYITKDNVKVTSAITVTANAPAFLLGTANGKGTPVKFRLDDSSDTGIISVSTGGSVTILAPNAAGKHAYVIAEIDENKALGYAKQTTKKVEIIVKEAELEDLLISKDGIAITDGKIIETYTKDKEFQLGVEGAPEGSTITYKLKDKLTADNETLEDVIAVSEDGLVTIKNASYTYQRNKVIVEATVKKSGYADKTVEVIINIDKAEQSKFNFPTNNYEEVVEAGSGSFSVKFQNGGSSGKIKMMSEDSRITIDGTKVTYVDIVDETILITAQQKGDRNYNDSEEKTMKLTALKEGETKFTVDISPSKLIYGGTAQFQPDEEPGVTYTYEADPSTIDIADIDPDNADKIITKKVGNAKFIITRYLNGVENGKANKTIKVWPKSISVKVKDYEKKVGEALPTYELEPITGLVGSDDLGTPVFSCDATATSPAKDSYVISAQFPDSEVLKNYELTSGGIKPGKLLVKQDEGKKAWYEILGTKGDEGWYTSDVTIKMNPGFDYDVFSQDQSSWNTQIGLTSEGIHNVELWFKNTITEALSSSIKEEIKIDKTAPIVSQIKAVNSNSSIEDILNDISFGNFFKPGTKINIYTSDAGKTDVEVSKTKEVSYKIYPLDKDGNEGTPKTGTAQSASEKASVTMNDVGRYKVCAVPKDHAGNPGEEQCAKVSIKDPEKDYDPNDLGCPSINLTMGTNKPILNIDRDGDGIPDMDIDTDGDGKPDINIDNDKDGKPDTNLIILKEWDPKICSTTEHSYGYVEDIKPLINIALDKEYKKPSINIDTTGDMKADINIDTDGDMKADLNIVSINIWKPEKNYIYKEFQYDTMNNLKRKVNIDTDGDGLPDVNIDYDGDGLPDLNIDINGDEIPDINIDTTGDGEPDINIDYENDGTIDANPGTITEWKPDLNTGEKDGFKYDTMSNIKVDDPIHELEHDPSGTVVETVDNNTSFNKKQTIIVADITNEMKLSGMPEVEKNIKGNQEVKNVLDVKLYEDNIVTQPNGLVRVKIPLSEELKKMKNRVIMIEQKDGTYKEVSVKEENGYLVFETDYLGKVSVVADKEETTIHPDVDDGNKGNASVDNGNKTTDDEVKSVKGASTIKGMGGAMTGDTTNPMLYISGLMGGLLLLLLLIRKKKTDTDANE